MSANETSEHQNQTSNKWQWARITRSQHTIPSFFLQLIQQDFIILLESSQTLAIDPTALMHSQLLSSLRHMLSLLQSLSLLHLHEVQMKISHAKVHIICLAGGTLASDQEFQCFPCEMRCSHQTTKHHMQTFSHQ